MWRQGGVAYTPMHPGVGCIHLACQHATVAQLAHPAFGGVNALHTKRFHITQLTLCRHFMTVGHSGALNGTFGSLDFGDVCD